MAKAKTKLIPIDYNTPQKQTMSCRPLNVTSSTWQPRLHDQHSTGHMTRKLTWPKCHMTFMSKDHHDASYMTAMVAWSTWYWSHDNHGHMTNTLLVTWQPWSHDQHGTGHMTTMVTWPTRYWSHDNQGHMTNTSLVTWQPKSDGQRQITRYKGKTPARGGEQSDTRGGLLW